MNSRFVSCALAFAVFQPVPLPAGDEFVLEARAMEGSGAVVLDDGTVEVSAGPVGISGLPPQSVEFIAPTPVEHTPDNAFQVRVTSAEPVLVTMTAYSTKTGGEVFPVRMTSGSGEPEYVRWTFDSRVGSADDPFLFRVGIGSQEGRAAVALDDYAIEPAVNLSDGEVIAASTWSMFSISHLQPRDADRSLEVFAAVPRVVARRSFGSRIAVFVDGERVSERTIGEDDTGSRALWQNEVQVPLGDYATGTHTVEAKLLGGDGRELALGSGTFSMLAGDRPFEQWEYAHQSIQDFEVFQDGPDLRIIAIVSDLYACAEPEGSETMIHEIRDTRATQDLSLSKDAVAWRTTAYGLWTSGGFNSMALGDYEGALSAYVTGIDPDGIEVLGHLSTVAYSEMRPSVKNPTWGPAEVFTGWSPGVRRAVRPISITTYGRGFLLVSGVQVADEEPVVVGALSNELLYWADAGTIPLDLPPDTRHMDIDHRDGVYYLYTDDPSRMFVSKDALRSWEPRPLSFPEDWFRFRVVLVDGREILLGLHRVRGKNVLRWREIEWDEGTGDIPVPHLKEHDAS